MNAGSFRYILRGLCVLSFPTLSLFHPPAPAVAQGGGNSPEETRMTIEVKGGDRDVDLKRMETLEKALSPDLIDMMQRRGIAAFHYQQAP